MNTRIKSIFMIKRLFFLLPALLMVTGLVLTQAPSIAFAWIDGDPPDDRVHPVDPPAFVAPSDGFTWAMDGRYGSDNNGDGMIDSHWITDSMKYEESYLFPDYWRVRFKGCQTKEDLDRRYSTTNTYTWQIVGDAAPFANGHSCFVAHDFTAQGTYTIRLTVHDTTGAIVPANKTDPEYFQQDVTIRDILIVSLGDSYASGEGNPDIQQTYHPKDFPWPGWDLDTEAVWQYKRCHRSAINGPSMAAIAIENSDPHTSVTFISFACSGATISKTMWDKGSWLMPLGSGILGPHWGAEFTGVWWSPNYENYIPPQMDQLEAAMVPPDGKPARQIDSLTISGGGNDMFFGDILANCLFNDNCFRSDNTVHEDPYNDTDYNLVTLIERALGHWSGAGGPAYTIPASYSALHDRINALQPVKPAHVYVTQYPDMFHNDNGSFCDLMGDNFVPNIFDLKFSAEEAQDAFILAQGPLNDHVREVAQGYAADGWQFVDGLSVYDVDPLVQPGTPGLFIQGHDGKGHGYCASQNWIRRAEEAELIEGPLNVRLLTKGQMHPNYSGHMAYKERLLRYMIPDLAVQQPQDPPEFTFSFSKDGFTDVASETTGWFLESCNGGLCQPKVVAQAVATSTLRMDGGAQVSVNGVNGCAIAGVSCQIPNSTNVNQVTFNVEITASGIYQFRFVAEDGSGQAASLEQEIKVDLEGPVFVTPLEPFEVEEGGSVTLVTRADDADVSVLDYAWDLDNDGTFETTDDQPSFSAAELDGPVTRQIQVKATDQEGRTATAQAVVNVSNVAPTVAISGAPASSPEGTKINLTSTVTDPGAADTLSYAWAVKKNGTEYATGKSTNFSFTPDDNGSYEVSLSATDDDGGVGTASQTIGVTNVAPAVEINGAPATSSEGTEISLSSTVTDPGSVDTLTYAWTVKKNGIDFASGVGTELSFTPDDNGTYAVAFSAADDDGGEGKTSATIDVTNVAPSVTITAPAYGTLYAVNTTISLSASLADPGTSDTLTCSVNWDDGSKTTGTVAAGVCTASRAYGAAGVYTIQMTATDDDGGSDTDSVMVVVYDPSAGFVTGGGWFNSPAGAYKVDDTLTGKASFGFVSKYQKGASVPTGTTAFQFQAGGFEFYSTAYEWLVVNQAATNAQFKGTGMVNGMLDPNGNPYKFMLWAGDGSPDTIRIKIWWEDASGEHAVYDNGIAQPIGGGNIVVHTVK